MLPAADTPDPLLSLVEFGDSDIISPGLTTPILSPPPIAKDPEP